MPLCFFFCYIRLQRIFPISDAFKNHDFCLHIQLLVLVLELSIEDILINIERLKIHVNVSNLRYIYIQIKKIQIKTQNTNEEIFNKQEKSYQCDINLGFVF